MSKTGKVIVNEEVITPPVSITFEVGEEVIFKRYNGEEESGIIISLPDETRSKYIVKLASGNVPINFCYLQKKV